MKARRLFNANLEGFRRQVDRWRQFPVRSDLWALRSMNTETPVVPRGPVSSELLFYTAPEDGTEPYKYAGHVPPGVPTTNFSWVGHLVTLSDLRGLESKFNLDNNAFQVLQNMKSAEYEFNDDERIKRLYYPELEKLLLDNVSGANRVFFFDHTVRRSGSKAHRSPSYNVHVDQTERSAATRVSQHLPDEAKQLLQSRYRIINVWRPINGPVYSDPLAIADSATVAQEDLVPVKRLSSDRTGEVAEVKYNPSSRWYYLSGMTNDERLLIKCFDSHDICSMAPHSAFKDPRSPPGAPRRESIEVRALVFG